MSSIHVGQLIRQVAKDKGIKFTYLSEALSMSRQNLNSVFQRKSVDLVLLYKFSEVLDYNFFYDVMPDRFKDDGSISRGSMVNEPEEPYNAAKKPRITLQIAIHDPSVEQEVLGLILHSTGQGNG